MQSTTFGISLEETEAKRLDKNIPEHFSILTEEKYLPE